MPTISTSEIRAHLSDTFAKVAYQGQRVVITRSGKRFVALVPVDDLELLEALGDHMDVEDARKALKEPGSIPWEKVKAELGL